MKEPVGEPEPQASDLGAWGMLHPEPATTLPTEDAADERVEESDHPHIAAARARRRRAGFWKGAGLAAGLVALVAVLLLGILLLAPLILASNV